MLFIIFHRYLITCKNLPFSRAQSSSPNWRLVSRKIPTFLEARSLPAKTRECSWRLNDWSVSPVILRNSQSSLSPLLVPLVRDNEAICEEDAGEVGLRRRGGPRAGPINQLVRFGSPLFSFEQKINQPPKFAQPAPAKTFWRKIRPLSKYSYFSKKHQAKNKSKLRWIQLKY